MQGGTLEFDEATHTYYYDGIETPSVTQMLRKVFPNKYAGIPQQVLESASQKGIAVHEAIERFEKTGEISGLEELRNYRFLKRIYGFTAKENEIPIVVKIDGKVVMAGRLDMITEQNGQLGVEDIKRTATVDKNSLFYQLNWYAIGYEQGTGEKIEYLKCLHLRESVRKRIDIPLNKEMAIKKLHELLEA